MNATRWIGMVAAACAAAACAGTPARVPVRAGPEGSAALAGEWEGSYQGASTGRSGSIVFHLDVGRDTATGDVVMVPLGAAGPLRRTLDAPRGAIVPAAQPQALTIRFVRVEGGRVFGMLDAYDDPDCGCPVRTRFEGTIAGNAIRGTFTTFGAPGGRPATGTWQVDRRAP
jgi:hypothetical protein